MRFLIVTGMSGAGKTSVDRHLEDMGALCVDNLPPALMSGMVEAIEKSAVNKPMVVMAVDVRSAEMFEAKTVSDMITKLRNCGHRIETLFLEASEEALVSRYKETRRDHPLASDSVSLTEAITRERVLMQPLRETANYILDTTDMKPRQLKARIAAIFHGETPIKGMRIEMSSFGYKRGLPIQADLVFDVRFLPNPFYYEGLGHQTGLDEDVKRFVLDHPVTKEFLDKTKDLLAFLIPKYQEEGKHRLAIAIGCTGGAHRSVAICEALAEFLRARGEVVSVTHRDMEVEQARWTAKPEVE